MRNSFFANVVLLLSVFVAAALAQAPADACLEYQRVANLSTVGSNSTYRSSFLAASPAGGIIDQRMFGKAILALPPMTADADLNSRCQNWTEIALAEAEKNFTQGIVLQFANLPPPSGIKAGPVVLYVVGLIMIMMSAVWSFAP